MCTVEGLSFSPSLQTHQFDVNRERTEEGDLLVHLAVQGGESTEPACEAHSLTAPPPPGLASLPLLLSLLNHFKADVNAKDGNGMTPLSLACRLGHLRVAEVRDSTQ